MNFFVFLLYGFLYCVSPACAKRKLHEWVGDTWLPPNGKLFTVKEIQQKLNNTNVLIIGDSLGRRLTSNLASVKMMNADIATKVMDDQKLLNTGGHGTAKWHEDLMFQWAPMAESICGVQIPKQTDIIVVAIGIHDATLRNVTSYKLNIESAIKCLLTTGKKMLWRTAPNMYDKDRKEYSEESNRRLSKFNSIVKALLPRKSLVDSAKSINFKSTGEERLGGDTMHHYGNIARMVQIQTLMYNI